MSYNLKSASEAFKKARNFNPEQYLNKKVDQINKFLIDNKLDSLVLGISGGIDSAVVLYILDKAKSVINSPIKQILPISMPIPGSSGVTGQEESARDAETVVESLDISYYEVNLEPASSSIFYNSCDVPEEHSAWAIGQMNSVLRTPVLYY